MKKRNPLVSVFFSIWLDSLVDAVRFSSFQFSSMATKQLIYAQRIQILIDDNGRKKYYTTPILYIMVCTFLLPISFLNKITITNTRMLNAHCLHIIMICVTIVFVSFDFSVEVTKNTIPCITNHKIPIVFLSISEYVSEWRVFFSHCENRMKKAEYNSNVSWAWSSINSLKLLIQLTVVVFTAIKFNMN